MSSLSSVTDRIRNHVRLFMQETFFQKKLNNWFGYLLLAGVAALFAYLLVWNDVVGLGLFGLLVGLLVVIICISNPQAGFYLIIAFSFFAYFLSNIAVYFFGFDMPVGLIVDCLIVATMLGMVINYRGIKRNFQLFTKHTLVIFIFFTLFFSAVQFLNPNAQSLNINILALRKFIGYVCIMFITFNVLSDYGRVKKFIEFLFIISTLCALYGCKQQWFGYFTYEMNLILRDPHGFALIFVGGDIRKSSTFSDPASFGIVMAVCAVFFLIISTHQQNKIKRNILIIGSIFMIIAMGYSGTRTAYAILVTAFGFFVLLNFNKKSTRVFGIVSGLIILTLIYGPFYGNNTIQRFRTTFIGAKDESYKVRVLSRAFIQPYIRSHPLGGGLGTTGFTGSKEHPGHFLSNFQPDSGYVMRAAETGWTGLLEICILYFIALVTGIRGFFRTRNEKIKILYAASITCLYAFYIAEFAQVAIGGVSDAVVYYPILTLIIKLKYFDTGNPEGEPGPDITALPEKEA